MSVNPAITLTLLITLLVINLTSAKDARIVFQDEFDFFDFTKWKHDVTLAGGGNWEFQWYTNNRSNSFVRDGKLFIKPTLTADHLGEAALTSQTLDLNNGSPFDKCTNAGFYGCVRTGTPQNLLNPVKSASVTTVNSFSFKYGRLEIRAKLPTGDWLWPAIWLLPKYNEYGGWPASGEIDVMESRGNRDLTKDGVNIGAQQIGSTLHWGPDPNYNKYTKTHFSKNNSAGYNSDFHIYELIWNEDSIKFLVDDEEIGNVSAPDGGFWEIGELHSTNLDNPWIGGSKMVPFDKEFYIIINLAVGGISYFPDDASNPKKKPWSNQSPTAPKDFWKAKNDWLPTWNLENSDDAALQIDYIRVYRQNSQ